MSFEGRRAGAKSGGMEQNQAGQHPTWEPGDPDWVSLSSASSFIKWMHLSAWAKRYEQVEQGLTMLPLTALGSMLGHLPGWRAQRPKEPVSLWPSHIYSLWSQSPGLPLGLPHPAWNRQESFAQNKHASHSPPVLSFGTLSCHPLKPLPGSTACSLLPSCYTRGATYILHQQPGATCGKGRDWWQVNDNGIW